jgi:hypothetical protein
MAGCNQLSAESPTIDGSTLRMPITNPHETLVVASVRVRWNALTGAPPPGSSGKPLALRSADLGTVFWTGDNKSGDVTIQLPTGSTEVNITLPGNNRTTTITFWFDNVYKNPLSTTDKPWIVLTFATPCDTTILQRPQ